MSSSKDHPGMYKEDQSMHLHLQQLSEDTLSHILGYLDARSKVRAWDTCVELRRAMHRRNLVRRVSLRYWRLPRVIYDFLRENTLYIEELDLSCAKMLSEELAVSALTKLENLRSLDITHTAVTLRGASAVCAACPSLVRLACDFGNVTPSLTPLSEPERESFKNLEYVHFVVANSLTSDPFDVLTLCCLKEFKLTIGRIFSRNVWGARDGLECLKSGMAQHPTLRSITCRIMYVDCSFVSLWKYFDTNGWDFLIAQNFAKDYRVYISDGLLPTAGGTPPGDSMDFWLYLDPYMNASSSIGSMLDLYAWRSDLIQRNPNLYTDVIQEVYSKIPQMICSKLYALKTKDAYFLDVCTFKESDLNIAEFVPPDRKITVSYSFYYRTCNCYSRCDTILVENFPVLRNIVHLTLEEQNFDSGLFEVLFKECVNLETLSVRVTHAGSIENIRHSRSMRNILIKGKIFQGEGELFDMLRALCACQSLEMVCICDARLLKSSYDLKKVDFEAFFQSNPALCTLCMEYFAMYTSESNLSKIVTTIMERQGNGDLDFRQPQECSILYLPSRVFYDPFNLDLEVNKTLDYS